MILMDIAPCKGCTKRKMGCHDRCDAYKEWLAIRGEIVKALRTESAQDYSVSRESRHLRYLRKQKTDKVV